MFDILGVGKGLKTAYDIAKAAMEVNDQARMNTAVIEIMDQLTSAQFGLFEIQLQHQQLIDENKEMRQALENQKNLDRYTMEFTPIGSVVWKLKPEFVSSEEVDHRICAKCRADGRLAPLSDYSTHYKCTYCESTFGNIDMNANPPSSRDWNPYD